MSVSESALASDDEKHEVTVVESATKSDSVATEKELSPSWLDPLWQEFCRIDEMEFDDQVKSEKLGALQSIIESGISCTFQWLTSDDQTCSSSQNRMDLLSVIESDVKEVESLLDALNARDLTGRADRMDDVRMLIKHPCSSDQSDCKQQYSWMPDHYPSQPSTVQVSSMLCESMSRGRLLHMISVSFKMRDNCELNAEHYAMKAVRIEPWLIPAWLTLGQLYSLKGELLASKCCYESALRYSRFKYGSSSDGSFNDASNRARALVLLSRVLRSPSLSSGLPPRRDGTSEAIANAYQSLERTKEAMKEDSSKGLLNGELWFSLGNAYLTIYLRETQHNGSRAVGSIPAMKASLLNNPWLQKCLSAFERACNTRGTEGFMNDCSKHPDLFYNRALVHLYRERYDLALNDLCTCLQCAGEEEACPQWNAVFHKLDRLQQSSLKLDTLLRKYRSNKKYKAKYTCLSESLMKESKRIQSYVMSSLKQKTEIIGSVSDLNVVSNEDELLSQPKNNNDGCVISLKLVALLSCVADPSSDESDSSQSSKNTVDVSVDYSAPCHLLCVDSTLNESVVLSLMTSNIDSSITQRISDMCVAKQVASESMFTAQLITHSLLNHTDHSNMISILNPIVRCIQFNQISNQLKQIISARSKSAFNPSSPSSSDQKPRTLTDIKFKVITFDKLNHCFIDGVCLG